MESVISIYKSLNAAVSVHLPQLQIPNDCNYKNDALNNSNSPKHGESEDSEMTDKDVSKRSGGTDSSSRDGSPLPTSEESDPRPKHQDWTEKQLSDHLLLYEFESEYDAANHTPESYTEQAAKNVRDITASEQPSNAARKRICGDSFIQESSPNPKTQDPTLLRLMESLRSDDPTDYVKAQNHQLPKSHTEQDSKRKRDITASDAMENHLKVPKRENNLMQKSADIDCNGKCSANSDDQLSEKISKALEQTSSNITICGFCQSARVSEATGEMLHYSRGRPVDGDDIFRSNVIHVHSACIEWAPQVYYEGDTVKNLKAELARGMKIKCTKCSLKGAALGCFVKSCRRSYHVPCAREISRCRWDYEDFLLLCPAHSSVKFPNEKSGHRVSRAEPLPKINPAELCSLEQTPAFTKELVLCGSALSKSDKVSTKLIFFPQGSNKKQVFVDLPLLVQSW
jgi:BRCA1-associated RING domain protein 1